MRVPDAYIPEAGARVMSLTDGTAKMSKSNPAEGSRINVLDTPDEIAKKIKRCKTDAVEGTGVRQPRATGGDEPAHDVPAVHGDDRGGGARGVRRDAVGGISKPALTDAVVSHLSPIQSRYFEIIEEPGYLDGLARGADAANEVAEKTVADVRDAMGFMERGVTFCVAREAF